MSWFFCIFTTHVPPTQSKEAVRQADIPSGPSMMEQPETCQQPPAAGFRQNRSRNQLEYFTENQPPFCRKEAAAGFRWVSGCKSLTDHTVYPLLHICTQARSEESLLVIVTTRGNLLALMYFDLSVVLFLRNSKIAGLSCLIILF